MDHPELCFWEAILMSLSKLLSLISVTHLHPHPLLLVCLSWEVQRGFLPVAAPDSCLSEQTRSGSIRFASEEQPHPALRIEVLIVSYKNV